MALGTKEKEREDYNPGQTAWDKTVNKSGTSSSSLSDYEKDALQNIDDNYNIDADPANENANIEKINQAEKNSVAPPPVKSSNEESSSQLSKKQKAANFMKNKGPLTLILTLLFGGGGGLFALMFPGMALVQLKEAFMEDLNDSVSSVDVRSQHIFRAKMKGQTSGYCSNSVSFRCKYKSMSKREALKLAKAGFILDPKEKTKLGRYKPQTISFKDSTGRTVSVDAKNFSQALRSNPEFRSKMFKAYNPRFSSLRDQVAGKVYSKFKISLKRALSGTKSEMNKQIDESVKKGANEIDGKKITKSEEDGKTVYRDTHGNEVELDDEQKKIVDATEDQHKINGFADKGNTLKSILGKGFRGANMITGSAAEACMVLQMVDMASLAAKNVKYAQLMRYVVPLLNTADSIKTGDASMEAVQHLGDTATHIDTRDKVLNEDAGSIGDAMKSVIGGNTSENKNFDSDVELTDNPHKGENAFDSAGFKASAYGEVKNTDMRENQFSLGGGMSGKMGDASKNIRGMVPGGKKGCDFVTNPLVQAGGFALSIAAIFGSGGAAAAVAGAKAAATTIVTMVITSYIQAMLTDITEGNMVNSETRGIDAGNAWFSGSAALTGSVASSRGLNPLSTEGEIKESQRIAFDNKQQYYELARYEAQSTPFDVYNKFSFLGSIVNQLYPVVQQSSSAASLTMLAPITYLSTAFSNLSPTAGAATTSPESRYKKCEDPTFQDINMQTADIMCNIRFGNSADELYADPEKVADWMIDARQIDPETGEVKSDEKAVETIKQVPVTGTEVAAVLHDMDDPNPPAIVASVSRSDPTKNTVKLADTEDNIATGEEPDDPVENVRTYAHWLRFCRFGVEGGRTVNFGDKDGLGSNALTGLTEDEYISDGRECLKSNACKPGQNPNSDNLEDRCRPPQYSIYSIFELDKADITNKEEEEGSQETDSSASGLVTGEAKELAKQLAENPNIEFVNPATKEDLLKFSETGQATNSCGQPFSINPLLSGVLLAEAKNYKILINNIGFQSDRDMCDSGQHPKGNAVDINGLKKLSGGETSWGSISYGGSETGIITDFTKDWMNILADKDPARGGVGQIGCGGFDITSQRDPKWQGPDGNLHFSDACNHLHIDVRDRNDTNKI